MNPWEKYASESASADKPWEKYGGTAIAEAAPEPPASLADKMVGGWGGRMLMGMASPVLAATQMAGGEKGRALIAELDAMKQRGMKAEGNDGFDAMGLIGSMMPGAGIAKGISAALPAATNALGRIGTGAAIGAATSAAQPVAHSPDFWADKGKQVGIGTAAGAAIPALASAFTAARGAPTLNPVQAQTLKEGQAAGYVVPPASVNPSVMNNRLESIAGKASVGQEAAKRNQDLSNALAAQDIGLLKETPLTPGAIGKIRDKAGEAYTDVANLSPKAEWALDELKQARHDTTVQFNHYNKSGDPSALTKAKEAKAWAGLLDKEMQDEATKAGRPDLIKALTEARMTIAKTYDLERALGADANASAPILGRLFDKKGEAGMSGNLALIGKMQQTFPNAMREGARVPASGVSGTDAAASAILGTLGYGAGGPAGILAAGLPLLRGPVRNLVLSKGYQQFATADPSKYQAMIDALAQQGAGAAGTAAGRLQP